MILSESEKGLPIYARQKKEITEQKDDAVIGTLLPTEDGTKLPLNKNTKKMPTAHVVKQTAKNVLIIPTPCKSDRTPINKSITDQDNLDKKDQYDYE